MSETLYRCPVCGKEIRVEKSGSAPVCCGREMEPLTFCKSVPNPEMARNYEADEPCDDGSVPRKH